ncbi:MAG: tetratricopeptide repeat protein [Pseudolabrys sp.]
MMAIQPTGPNERQRAQAETLQKAQQAIQGERPAEAERLAGEILKANAGHAEAIKILGYALLMQGRAEEAVAPLEKAARASHDPEIETQLAIALRQDGDSDKALLWLQRAVKRMPPFAPAFHELGCVLHSLDRSDEAIAVFRQGIALAPMMADMWLQLGAVHLALKQRADAGRAFAQALAINPVHPEATHGLVSVLVQEGNFAQAAELLRRVIAASPDDTLARIGLGNCLLELGQADTAYACLRAAAVRGARFHGVLSAVLMSGHGRFWLRPSSAEKFFKGGSGEQR